jgi:hypothetical protein
MISEKDKSSKVCICYIFALKSGPLLTSSLHTTTLQPIVMEIKF